MIFGALICRITGQHKWGKAKSQNAIAADKLKECKRCGEFRTVKPRKKA